VGSFLVTITELLDSVGMYAPLVMPCQLFFISLRFALKEDFIARRD